MLTEERKNLIIKFVESRGGMTVQELMHELSSSESTIRRDLTDLGRRGLVLKVHGGALPASSGITADIPVQERDILHRAEKKAIAAYAADLIGEDDVVYIDAGTTTSYIMENLRTRNTVFVTNAIAHAGKLTELGYHVYMPCGLVKIRTEALVGADTCNYLKGFHFTKGFFGSNGITRQQGFTTPDREEAAVKRLAMEQSGQVYVLSDSSKFGRISSVTFGDYESAGIITDWNLPAGYKNSSNIIVVEEPDENKAD